MFMQAWGNYGTAWSVIHQQLGLRPFISYRELDVVPQVPPGQRRVAGSHIRLGNGWVTVAASRARRTYVTRVDARHTPARILWLGTTLPRRSRPVSVILDGRAVRRYRKRRTNRGLEVTVRAAGHERHVVTVRSR
jgi:hypothetical protein